MHPMKKDIGDSDDDEIDNEHTRGGKKWEK